MIFVDTETVGRNGHANVLDEPDAPPAREIDRLLAVFAEMVDTQTGPIGRVVGSEKEPAGAHQFCIWASEQARTLDVGHIVVAFSEDAAVVGVVDEPRRYSDLRSFLDDFYDRHLEEALEDEPPTRRPEILVFCINVLATKHIRDDVTSHRPPVAGPVYFATTKAIEYALGHRNFSGVPIPALMHTNGNAERDAAGEPTLDERGNVVFQRAPIWLDEDYLLGPEAGHANWTGQSGLATKTSHALFLTSAVFQQMRREGKTVATLMFNVKGPDLLWLDKPAVPDQDTERAYAAASFRGLDRQELESYSALGLIPEAFQNLRIFAPFKPGQVPFDGDVYLESLRPQQRGQLNTLRNAPSEVSCVHPILLQLDPFLWQPHKIFERDDLDDKLLGFIAELRDVYGVTSFADLDRVFAQIEDHFSTASDGKDTASEWHGHHKFTIRKARNRLQNLSNKYTGLLARGTVDYGKLPRVDSSFSDGEIRVVDIAHCNSNVQEFLVGSVIHQVWKMAEQGEEQSKDDPRQKTKALGVDKVIVFVDELNKYAPGGSQGGLRDTLVDIAARGRHLNVVLFGAQQFRSKVDDEILGNCGTSFYGRIGDEEIVNASYRSLSDTAKAELLGLPKGQLLVRHAHFRSPLFGRFPRPPVLSGMDGQRIFNDATTAKADTHPGDGLYNLLRQLGVIESGLKGKVRTETDGLTVDVVAKICESVQATVASKKGTSAESRFQPWSVARHQIAVQKQSPRTIR